MKSEIKPNNVCLKKSKIMTLNMELSVPILFMFRNNFFKKIPCEVKDSLYSTDNFHNEHNKALWFLIEMGN